MQHPLTQITPRGEPRRGLTGGDRPDRERRHLPDAHLQTSPFASRPVPRSGKIVRRPVVKTVR